MIKVIKRNKTTVDFNQDKIIEAILAASRAANECIPLEFARATAEVITAGVKEQITVEQIQDQVEIALMRSNYFETARKYVIYRHIHNLDRKKRACTVQVINEIIEVAENDINKENANINAATVAGKMSKIGTETAKDHAKDYLLNPEHAKAHDDGLIHIHDLDYYATKSTTCLPGDTFITLKDPEGNIINTRLSYLDSFFKTTNNLQAETVPIGKYQIAGRNGWTLIEKATRRLLNDNEQLIYIKTAKGLGLKVTKEHKIPILRSDKEVLVSAGQIVKGDQLLGPVNAVEFDEHEYIDVATVLSKSNINTEEICICNINKLKKWFLYRYDITNFSLFINSQTSKNGTQYITLEQYNLLRAAYEIPYDVVMSLGIKVKFGQSSIPLMLPITEELVKFIGYIYGDGSVYINHDIGAFHLSFINHNPQIMEDFSQCVKVAFFKDVKPSSKQPFRITIGDKLLTYLLFDGIGYKSGAADIKIPEFLFTCSEKIKFAFLSSLIDTDGNIDRSSNLIAYSTVCRSFAEQIVKLLKSLGIDSQIHSRKSKGTVASFNGNECIRNHDSYKVVVTGNCNVSKYLKGLSGFKAEKFLSSYAITNKSVHREPLKVKDVISYKDKCYVYDLQTVEHWFIANDYVVHNCTQIDLIEILNGGFKATDGEVREPKSIRTAGQLAAIIMQSNQNEQHGGQSYPNWDFAMAKYVRKSFLSHFIKAYEFIYDKPFDMNKEQIYIDNMFLSHREEKVYKQALKLTRDEVYQSMEAFLHNMILMHSRGGGQIVFSSINYGTDTSTEGRMVIEALLDVTEQGSGKEGMIFSFPIQIFKIKDGISYSESDFHYAKDNWEKALKGELKFKAPNFDLFLKACRVSSQRLFPNFVFLDATFNKNEKWQADDPSRYKYEICTMGCRTRVWDNLYGEKSSISRGNLSFTSLNLVRLAIEAKQQAQELTSEAKFIEKNAIELFYTKLDESLNIAADQLYSRFKFQGKGTAQEGPFLFGQNIWMDGATLQADEHTEQVLKHGTLSIGFIGLAEALVMLTGKHHGQTKAAQKLGLEIVRHMRGFCDKKTQELKLNFSLLATPAEGLSGRFTTLDKEKYGIIAGVTDREYYTNSSHVPVYYDITALDKILIEAPYHALENAGHILYVEMDTMAKKNLLAFMSLIRQMFLADVGYGTINHEVTRCLSCGFDGTITLESGCPKCGEKTNIDQKARITGYLSPLPRWSSYKLAEKRDRLKHSTRLDFAHNTAKNTV